MHVLPVTFGFLCYCYGLTFLLMRETLYIYYALTLAISSVLVVFFGRQNYYAEFEHLHAKYEHVGCRIVDMPKELGCNRLAVYYPA